MKLGVIIGVTLTTGFVLVACGNDEAPDESSISLCALDRRIPDLPKKASVAVIEARLGPANSKVVTGNELVLPYRPWRLVVVNGHLARRIRSRNAAQAGGFSDRESKFRDQKVLALRLGTSLSSVRKVLGAPEDDEEVIEANGDRVVILRYGAWGLRFAHGRLRERTKS